MNNMILFKFIVSFFIKIRYKAGIEPAKEDKKKIYNENSLKAGKIVE